MVPLCDYMKMSALPLKVLAHMLLGRKLKKIIFRGSNKEMKVACWILFVKNAASHCKGQFESRLFLIEL